MENIPTKYGVLEIIYEDAHVISFIKPCGLLSQGAEGDEDSVIEHLTRCLGTQVYPVHRLDRTTGGVMIAAKDPTTAGALSKVISDGGMNKVYLATVHGNAAGGRLEDTLFFDRKRNKSFVVKPSSDRKGVKKAVLEYTPISRSSWDVGDVTLVKVKLMTGRTHQIRVQMSNAGHPLLGDGKYGGRDNKCGCALWSHEISFDVDMLRKYRITALAAAVQKQGLRLESTPCGYPWDRFI